MAKDATTLVVTLISESYAQEDVAFPGDTVRGKGTLILDNEVMAYPEIPDVATEFAARLQFSTTFEVMEFLAEQQIKLSQRLAKQHEEMQMIQRALVGTTEREDEHTLDKIGRMENADEGRIGI